MLLVNASVVGSGPFTYDWYLGASPDVSKPLGSTQSSTFTTPALYGGDQTLWARVSASCGSPVDSAPVTIRLKCNLSVSPRFLQGDPPWGSNLYDSTSSTIGDLGSGLAAFATGLRFAGAANINTPSTKPLDPGTLNDFLNLLGTSGYDPSANVLFLSAAQFVGLDQNPILPLTFNTFGATDDGFDSITSPLQAFGALDASLCSADPYPIIVRVRSPKSGQYPTHYVLVTGKDISSSGIVKYSIADPGDFGTDLNSAPYTDTLGRPEFRTRGAVVKANSSSATALTSASAAALNSVSDQSALEVATGETADLVLIDGSGKRTGLDSASGKHVAELSLSSVFRDLLTNNLTGALGRLGHSVQVLQPGDGAYRIIVLGLKPGPYDLLIHGFRKDGKAQPPVRLNGTVAAGSSFTFTLNYSSTGTSADIKQVVGDVNGDAKVDCTDVAVVRAAFGKKAGQSGFDPRADLNVDGVVDVRDLLAVTQRLPAGSVCGPTLTVGNSGAGQGTVSSAPGGINCGSACSAQFKEQTQVALTAKPSANSDLSDGRTIVRGRFQKRSS